jgi:glutamate synthase domain-containing protein 2
VGKLHILLGIHSSRPDHVHSTGAAPPEYSNHVGTPLLDGNLLRGAGIRDKVKVIASGKIISGFGLFRALALGADIGNSARGMMFALGCIQSLKCNTNKVSVVLGRNSD